MLHVLPLDAPESTQTVGGMAGAESLRRLDGLQASQVVAGISVSLDQEPQNLRARHPLVNVGTDLCVGGDAVGPLGEGLVLLGDGPRPLGADDGAVGIDVPGRTVEEQHVLPPLVGVGLLAVVPHLCVDVGAEVVVVEPAENLDVVGVVLPQTGRRGERQVVPRRTRRRPTAGRSRRGRCGVGRGVVWVLSFSHPVQGSLRADV